MPNTVSLTVPGTDRRTEVPTGLFVDGRWVDIPGTFDVLDPATGAAVATVASATPDDAIRALDAAVMTRESSRPLADPAAPLGGTKTSGLGREDGHDALDEFLDTQYIALTV